MKLLKNKGEILGIFFNEAKQENCPTLKYKLSAGNFCLNWRATAPLPHTPMSPGAELCQSCAPPGHQHTSTSWLTTVFECNCCSKFAYHVVAQITVSHFVSNIFCFIMENSIPQHPPPVNPSLQKSNIYGGRLSFKTQLKIEYLLPYTGSRKVLVNIPGSFICNII
jgi:hypothetical protein